MTKHSSTAQKLTDITSIHFTDAYQKFKQQGDFIAFTAQFEQGFLQTGNTNTLHFEVNHTTLSLLDTGVLMVEPHQVTLPIKQIVLSAGVHGNETAPIEILARLIRDIVLQKITVRHRILFVIGNPVAMNSAERFQDENLNRLFNGFYRHVGACYETLRAQKLETYVTDFFMAHSKSDSSDNSDNTAPFLAQNAVINYHYDLHTAIRDSVFEQFAICAFQEDKHWDKSQLSFIGSCGVNTILFAHQPSGTFSYFTRVNFCAHSFTIELGKVNRLGENDMTKFIAITQQLIALITQHEPPTKAFNNKDFTLFNVSTSITKLSENFQLFVRDDVHNFTEFPVNTLLSLDDGAEYRTSQPGERIVFPNTDVGIGQRVALMVVPTVLN